MSPPGDTNRLRNSEGGGLETAETLDLGKTMRFLEHLKSKDGRVYKLFEPQAIASNNPYLNDLVKYVNALKDSEMQPEVLESERGKLILKYADASKKDIEVAGKPYFALIFPGMRRAFKQVFGQDVEDEIIQKSLEGKLPRFTELAYALEDFLITEDTSTGYEKFSKKNESLIASLKEELSSPEIRARLRGESLADMTRMRGELERQQIANETDLASAFDIDPKTGRSRVDFAKFDKLYATMSQEQLSINADNWKPFTKDGLDKMEDDWEKLGLPVNQVFYQEKIFKQFRKCFDTDLLSGMTDAQKVLYMDPETNIDKIRAFDPDFARAWDWFKQVQQYLVIQAQKGLFTAEAARDQDRTKFLDTLTDGVKRNLEKFKAAIRNRDWATAALYGVGVYAIYKIIKTIWGKSIPGFDPARKFTWGKAFIYAAGAYVGNEMLKTAGIDLLEMVGFKDIAGDVKGTQLESFYSLGVPDAEKVKGSILLKTKDFSVKELYGYYKDTNVPDAPPRWIDPAHFASNGFYPQFKTLRPSDWKTNEEYKFVGEQLYLIMDCLFKAYSKTLMTDESPGNRYFGVDFDRLLDSTDPLVWNTNVRQLVSVLAEYAPNRKSAVEIGFESKNREAFYNIFKDTDMAPKLSRVMRPDDAQGIDGSLMGVPIVLVISPKTESAPGEYLIYYKKDYLDKGGNPSKDLALGRIPMEGETKPAVDSTRAAIEAKMGQLTAPLQMLEAPHYEGGQWVCKVKIPKVEKYAFIKERESKAVIVVRESGMVSIVAEDIGMEVNLDYYYDQQKMPYEGILLSYVATAIPVLAPFYNAKKMHITNDDLSDIGNKIHQFEIEVAGEKVVVICDENVVPGPKFSISEADQQKLLKAPEFRQGLVEALAEDTALNEVFEELKSLIDNAPEQYHFYLFEGFWEMLKGVSFLETPTKGWSLDFISGSVSDNFANAVLESKKQSMLYALLGGMRSARNFEEAAAMKKKYWDDMISSLKAVAGTLSKGPPSGSTWDRSEFMLQIIDPIKRAGVSQGYADSEEAFSLKMIKRYSLKGSDIFKNPHSKLNQLKALRAYYVAPVDMPKLGRLSYQKPVPPTGVDARTFEPLDPYYRESYIRYIDQQIDAKLAAFGDEIPNPESLGLPQYEDWKKTAGIIVPLNEIDKDPPFEHDSDAATESPLEKELMTKLTAMVDRLKKVKNPAGSAKTTELDKFIQEFKLNDLQSSCDNISRIAGDLRSKQIEEMDLFVIQIQHELVKDDIYWDKLKWYERLALIWE